MEPVLGVRGEPGQSLAGWVGRSAFRRQEAEFEARCPGVAGEPLVGGVRGQCARASCPPARRRRGVIVREWELSACRDRGAILVVGSAAMRTSTGAVPLGTARPAMGVVPVAGCVRSDARQVPDRTGRL